MFNYLKDKLSGESEDESDPEARDKEADDASETNVENTESEPESSKSFLSKATDTLLNTTIDEDRFDDLFWELERLLLANNVAKDVVDALKDELREDLVDTDVPRTKAADHVKDAVRSGIKAVLKAPETSLIEHASSTTPLTIAVVGVNGSGKTTTVAKLTKYFQDHEKTCVVGAADTYRAAAIQQLQEHTDALNTKLIKHEYGADPAAVAYDTVQHGESAGKDVCLIDTAGRLHNDDNLMEQLKKIIRVAEPDLILYVAEAVTGNDAVRQAEAFQDHVSIDGVIMTKVDADDKGGAVLSVSYVTGAPIYFLGTGQGYDDLDEFNPDSIVEELGL